LLRLNAVLFLNRDHLQLPRGRHVNVVKPFRRPYHALILLQPPISRTSSAEDRRGKVDLSGDPTFPELLERVRQAVMEGHVHQELPF